jgi:hypothetical protein
MRNALMSQGDEVIDSKPHPGILVRSDDGHRPAPMDDPPPDHHQWHCVGQPLQIGLGQIRRELADCLAAIPKQRSERSALVMMAGLATKDDVVAGRICGPIDRPEQISMMEGVDPMGDAEEAAIRSSQELGARVGSVGDLSGDGENASTGRATGARGAADHDRHKRSRNARRTRDVLERGFLGGASIDPAQ